jgi:hypothetical protein
MFHCVSTACDELERAPLGRTATTPPSSLLPTGAWEPAVAELERRAARPPVG